MQRRLLKSKIHRATVTEADLHYAGSISVDPELMCAADLLANEQVSVLDINNGARFDTYVIEGVPRQICLNGAAARLVQPGDLVIILSYADMDDTEAAAHKPNLVFVDQRNVIVDESAAAILVPEAAGRERAS